MSAVLPAAPRLSVIVITRNEAHQLGRCLGSVGFADEVVVVDSASTDGTQALARSLGARVIETTEWPGFGKQKQRALEAATGEWVLCLDADEWLDATLADAIRRTMAAPDGTCCGYELTRLSAFCGQWMRASGWYPDRGLRLVRRPLARFTEDLVHEHLTVQGPVALLPGLLLHDSIPSLESAIDKMNRYSSGRARDLLAKGRRGGLGSALGHGLWAFLRTYVVKRGFLDGRLGLVLALHNAETTYYRYLKMWLLSRPGELGAPPPGP
jgi:glycosyltransferase involved in cell wall biosynthesis